MVRGFPKLQWGKNGKNNLVREVMKMGKKKRKREKRKRNRIKKNISWIDLKLIRH